MGSVLCFVSITSCAAKNVAKSTLGDLFDALTAWVLSSVEWFINGVGGVLASASEPAFLFRQPPDEAKEMGVALNLHRNEERVLIELSKGTMIARYGRHRSIVKVCPDSRDIAFIDTDKAMRTISSTIQ